MAIIAIVEKESRAQAEERFHMFGLSSKSEQLRGNKCGSQEAGR